MVGLWPWPEEERRAGDHAGAHAHMDRRRRLLRHRCHLPSLRAAAPRPWQGALAAAASGQHLLAGSVILVLFSLTNSKHLLFMHEQRLKKGSKKPLYDALLKIKEG